MIERLKAMKYDKPFVAEKNEQKEE